MKTQVEALEDNRTKVTATFDAKDIDERIKQAYRDVSYKQNFPGFRKGKAPRPVIDNMLGKDAVRATVTDDLVNSSYPLIVDDCRLYPLGRPAFEKTTLVEDGKPYSFTFTISVKPEFELTSYDPVDIEMPNDEVTDEEIDEQIEALREYYYSFEELGPRTTVKADSPVDIAMTATDDAGEKIASLTTESRPYTLGSNLFPEEFDEHLVGLKKGEKATFVLDMPENPPVMLAGLVGRTTKINCEVEIQAVKKKILPEVTDEWTKEKIGFNSVTEMREAVADSVKQQKDSMMPRIKENAVLEAVAKRLEGEAPQVMCEEAESNLLQDFFTQLQRQNIPFDAYLAQEGITSDQFKEDVKEQAGDVARQDLALDSWARHFKFEATDKDIDQEFAKAGSEDPKASRQEWRENGQLYLVRQAIERTKAVLDLMESAKVTEVGSDNKESKKDDEDGTTSRTSAATKAKSTQKTAKKSTAASTKETTAKKTSTAGAASATAAKKTSTSGTTTAKKTSTAKKTTTAAKKTTAAAAASAAVVASDKDSTAKAGTSKASTTKTTASKTSASKTSATKTAASKTSASKTSAAKTSAAKSTTSKTSTTKAAATKTSTTKAAATKTGASKTTASKASASKTTTAKNTSSGTSTAAKKTKN